MTDFIENTTLKLENLFMRQPTSSDVLTVKQNHWYAITVSIIGK